MMTMTARSGFTLFEVIVVILMIALLSVAATVRLRDTRSELVRARDTLIQNLAYARSRAMATTNVWSLAYGSSIVLTRDGTAVALPDPASATPPGGVTIASGSVTFDRWGAPDAGKTITLTYAGGGSAAITINANTGLIE